MSEKVRRGVTLLKQWPVISLKTLDHISVPICARHICASHVHMWQKWLTGSVSHTRVSLKHLIVNWKVPVSRPATSSNTTWECMWSSAGWPHKLEVQPEALMTDIESRWFSWPSGWACSVLVTDFILPLVSAILNQLIWSKKKYGRHNVKYKVYRISYRAKYVYWPSDKYFHKW